MISSNFTSNINYQMGNIQKNEKQNAHYRIMHVEDERFGGRIQLTYENMQVYATKSLRMLSTAQLNNTVEIVKKRTKLVHRNFSTVKDYSFQQSQGMCGDSISLNLVYEFYENDLEREIKRRAPRRDYFPESEIWRMLFQMCDCLKYLQERKCYHGDIRPCTTFLTKKQNVRLQDSYFTHHGMTNLEFLISKPTCKVYLSPSQLNILRKGSFSFGEQQVSKNEIFSVGMTIMEAMLLESSFDCYDMLSFRIINQRIQQKTIKMKKLFSNQLVKLILEILTDKPLLRPSYVEVLSNPKLKSYIGKVSIGQDTRQIHTQKEIKIIENLQIRSNNEFRIEPQHNEWPSSQPSRKMLKKPSHSEEIETSIDMNP